MDKDDNTRKEKFDLAEIFLVAADIHRTFVATRFRKEDDNGEEFVIGIVKIHEGEVISRAKTEEALEKQLDVICKWKLDYGLHTQAGKSSEIISTNFFIN